MPTVTGRATDFITFSRTSNATVTGADGKIKWAGHNLLTNSESFDASAWLKTHGTSATPVVTANAAAAPNGTTTADRVDFGAIDAAGDYSVMYQTFTALDTSYTAGVWVKALAAGDVGKKVWLYLFDTANRGQITITLTADWQYVSTTATLTSGTRSFYLSTLGSDFGGSNQAAASVLVWGAHLYRSDLGGMVLNPARGDAYYPTTPRNLAKYTESWGVGAFGWTIGNVTTAANSTIAPNGLQTADLIYPSSTGTNRQTYQSTAGAVSGTRVVVSAYLKSGGMQWVGLLSPNGNNYGCYFDLVNGVKGTEAAGVTGTITSVGNGWYRCSVSEVLSATTIYGGISLADANNSTTVTASGTSGVYAWGLQFSDSASLDAYSPVYGAAVTSAAYYAPRLDYSGSSLAALGLLVEEQRTNILLHSAAFDNAYWQTGSGSVTVTANATTAPDGTTTADFVIPSAASAFHRIFTADLGQTAVSYSVFVKAGGYSKVALRESATQGSYISVDLATGTIIEATSVGTGTVSGATITNVGSGWYRISGYFVTPVNSSWGLVVLPDSYTSGSVTGSWTGDGVSGVYVWGAQAEASASFATSYIPTGASTATRTADVASVSTQAFPYSSTASSIVISLRHPTAASPFGSNQGHWRLDLAGSPVVRQDRFDNSANIAFRGLSLNVDTGKSLGTSVGKVATAFTTGDVALVVNGGSAYTNSSAAGSQVADNFLIGRTGVTSEYLNGWIRQITYIPRRLSNSELQARTV